MCQINEKNMECKCEQICCKMRNDSLRCAINDLKKNQDDSNTILNILEAISNVIAVYSCLPGTCLLKRVQWVQNNVISGRTSLYESEKTKVNMLISELEAFLSNS